MLCNYDCASGVPNFKNGATTAAFQYLFSTIGRGNGNTAAGQGSGGRRGIVTVEELGTSEGSSSGSSTASASSSGGPIYGWASTGGAGPIDSVAWEAAQLRSNSVDLSVSYTTSYSIDVTSQHGTVLGIVGAATLAPVGVAQGGAYLIANPAARRAIAVGLIRLHGRNLDLDHLPSMPAPRPSIQVPRGLERRPRIE